MIKEPRFFKDQQAFRAWLEENHQSETELLVGFYTVGSKKPSITWPQSVDQALCFGWIDGVRKSIDKESYSIRFTPRKANSIWSNVNIKKVEELSKLCLMQPGGLKAYKSRKEERSGIYAFENKAKVLPVELEEKFKANEVAWAFFRAQAPSYQRTIIHWIASAKQEATQLSRLEKAMRESENGKRVL